MLKILSPQQTREADQYTIAHEPISSIDLMERAAEQLSTHICEISPPSTPIHIICGCGNNGGDGLALARILFKKKYRCEVYLWNNDGKSSTDNVHNLERLERETPIRVKMLTKGVSLPTIDPSHLIVDALFGSGLNRPVSEPASTWIQTINSSNSFTIAIDIPSGLFADESASKISGAIVRANLTLSFQLPKMAFFFAENDIYVGNWAILPIGLHPKFLQEAKTDLFLVEPSDVKNALKKRSRFSHKGNYGHGLLVSGSYGKMGAAILAAKAALRCGIGLLSAHIPQNGYNIIQTATPETMADIDSDLNCFTHLSHPETYSAIGIGPGIGTSPKTAHAFKLLIQNYQWPMVIDADAINILAQNKTWINFLPKKSILTPHPKEFERLIGKTESHSERVRKQRDFSIKHSLCLVLKGAYTSISFPDGRVLFNNSGNPGMATAGSGDVLTGMILSLLAQGYQSEEAATIGVFIHGFAGDIAAKKVGLESLIAGDIIENISEAFLALN